MRTLIFEGIATSGKSTIVGELEKSLSAKLKVRVAREDETHVPIMNDRDGLHIEFFKDLLVTLSSASPDLIILDRLYMTQAFRAKCDIDDYKDLEEFLRQFNPLTIFLTINEKAISERIKKATEHREPEWAEYVKSRGQEDQIAQYYIDQQHSQLELLKQSAIPYKVIDATDKGYEAIVNQLIDLLED